jgi:hypothetical protein
MVISDLRVPDVSSSFDPPDDYFVTRNPVTDRIGQPAPLPPQTLNNNYKNSKQFEQNNDQLFNRFIGNPGKSEFLPESEYEFRKRKLSARHSGAKGKATMRPFDSIPIRLNSVSQIDIVARIVFPICFLIINYFYWITYLHDDE